MAATEPHLRFHRAVRGAIVAEANFDSYREREVGWAEVREAWTRPQRNGRPTPWEGLVGKASARSGAGSDAHRAFPNRTVLGLGSSGSFSEARCDGSDGSRSLGLGKTKVPIDATRYYYLPTLGIPISRDHREGPLTWLYDGQQVFSSDPPAPSDGWRGSRDGRLAEHVDGASVPAGAAIDGEGRRWRQVERDAAQAESRRMRYAQRVLAQFSGHPESTEVGRVGRRFVPRVASGATEGFGQFERRYKNVCKQLVNTDYPLTASGHPFNDRARKVVDLWTSCGASGGSGTMIDDRHVLTAAHVIVDGDGNYRDNDKMLVCAYGNCSSAGSEHPHEVRCYGIGWVHAPDEALRLSAGAGVGSTDWDFGIVTFNNIVEGKYRFGWMSLSVADGGLASVADHVRGYPGDEPDCTTNSNCPSPVVSNRKLDGCSAFDPNNSQQYYAMGEVLSIWSGELEFSTSSGPGISGAPHYYCPTGDCEDGHYLTAVHSGSTNTYSYGSKASSFRDWVLDFAFNYE